MADEEIQQEAGEEVVHHESHPKGKKISLMNLSEIETALKKVQQTMGGFNSNYARQLLAKKSALAGSLKTAAKKKAA